MYFQNSINQNEYAKSHELNNVPRYTKQEKVWKTRTVRTWYTLWLGTKEEPYYDYETVIDNDRINEEKEIIRDKYNSKIQELRQNIYDIDNKIDKYQEAINYDTSMKERLTKKIERLKQDKIEAEKEQERLIADSKSSWIRNQKKKLQNNIAKWFENGGEIYENLLEGIRTTRWRN